VEDKTYSWPETCLYGSLKREIPHAIGVISINWLYVESAQEQLIHYYLGVDGNRARLLTTHLSNDARTGLLKGLVESNETDSRFEEAAHRFLTCFEAAKHNRNMILHSICAPGPEGTTLISRTARGRVKIYDLLTDEEALTRVGREIRTIYHFGHTVWECLRGRSDGVYIKLPDLIAAPERLAPRERGSS